MQEGWESGRGRIWPGSAWVGGTRVQAVGDLQLVNSKKYPGQATTVDYTYNNDGSLATRTWERTDGSNRLRTRYGYSDHGQLTSIDYGSTVLSTFPTESPYFTPTVTFGYDRAGRVRYRGDDTGHTRLEYRYDGTLLTEFPVTTSADTGTVVSTGRHLRRTIDIYGRQTKLEASWGGTGLGTGSSQGSATHSPDVTYGYTTADRLSTINSAGYTGTLTRTSSQDSITVGTSGMMYPPYSTYNTITKSATGLPWQHTAMYAIGYNNQYNTTFSMSSSAFTWDSDRLATRGGENGGATRWNYTYDEQGQIATAKKTFLSGGAVFKGTETLYNYDNIGNRDVVKEGPTLRETDYTANERNQYTSLTRQETHLTAQIVGQRSNSTAKIKINNNDSAVLENVEYLPSNTGLYFYKEISNTPSSPASGDIFEPLYATQNGVDISPNQPDFAFVGAVSVTPQYDLDGNLIYDGRWTYTWDGENRLIKMTAPVWTQPAAGGYQSPESGGNTIEALTMQFTYDGLSRRVTKTVTVGTTGTSREGYLYDGWHVVMVAQLNSSGAFALRKWSCIWKPDVRSSLHARSSWQAAGGVGGLAWMQTGITQAYYPPYFYGNAEIHVPMADHMGNIRHYFQIKSVAESVTGQVSGNFEYDAFGREVRAWGPTTGASPPPGLPANKPFVDQLPFHFSSKYTDQESGFNYYGYRYYNAEWGRWLNRDPILERGGVNLYALCYNSALNFVDDSGLAVISTGSGLMPTSRNIPGNPISNEAEHLQSRINRLSPGDNARLFLNTQKAILDKLADGRCCLTKAQLDWLEKLIRDFMRPLIDSLDGNVPSGSGWDNTLNKKIDCSNRTNNRDADVIDDPDRGGARRLREVTDARFMALVHICEDLRNSLRNNGVGEDSVWACVGQAVAEAEAENFSPMERRISKVAGRLDSTYDVSRFRDNMRDQVKAEGVPRYPNSSDPTSLLP